MRHSNLIAVCLLLSCAHTRPDELTVEAHRAEAAAHRSASAQERAQYDPDATVVVPPLRSLNAPPLAALPSTYNPSAEHLAAADAELRKAAEHLEAARALESFEDAACQAIAPRERAACPLLASAVSQVRQVPVGVELTLRASADADDVGRRLNCHLAYAVANGFEASCPLFVKGMRIRRSGPATLELAGATQGVALELQQQARRLFARP